MFVKKRGQVTVFIIIAILVVGIGVLVYLFFPGIRTTTSTETENPYSFIEECLEDEIKNNLETINLQGGIFEPVFYYTYEGNSIEYLCYTNDYHELCVVQQPMLVQKIEKELLNSISSDVDFCFDSLETNFINQNFQVNLQRGETLVEILPERVVVNFDSNLTLTKDDSQNYRDFNIILNNNLYQMTAVANSIVNWETTYGDSDPSTYMNYYRNLKVEKHKQADGTTIYVLTERDTQNKLQFASRSLVLPPGYAP